MSCHRRHARRRRYRLTVASMRFRGAPYWLQIHHPAWPLQAADAEVIQNRMAGSGPDSAPLFHYLRTRDRSAWAPERLAPVAASASTDIYRATTTPISRLVAFRHDSCAD
jgi:hypothetical protein